jgi:hypothetical protein
MSCRALKIGCQLGIKSKETKNFFSDPDLGSAPGSFEGVNSEKSKVKRHPCLDRPRNDYKNKKQNKNAEKANADAVHDVPHVCFCAKKAKTMMLRL